MTLPLGKVFFLTEVFFPVHADASFVGASDMSPEVHCNLCNHCYTLGMSDPRSDIRCVQYLPKVHPKMPNGFWASSGTPETPEVYNIQPGCWKEIHHIIECADMDPPHHMMLNRRSSSSPIDVHTQGGTSKIHHADIPATCRILQVASHPLALARAIHFIFKH